MSFILPLFLFEVECEEGIHVFIYSIWWNKVNVCAKSHPFEIKHCHGFMSVGMIQQLIQV